MSGVGVRFFYYSSETRERNSMERKLCLVDRTEKYLKVWATNNDKFFICRLYKFYQKKNIDRNGHPFIRLIGDEMTKSPFASIQHTIRMDRLTKTVKLLRDIETVRSSPATIRLIWDCNNFFLSLFVVYILSLKITLLRFQIIFGVTIKWLMKLTIDLLAHLQNLGLK